MINDIVCIQIYTFFTVFRLSLFKIIKHALSTFEAENRPFHKHAEAQLKKVRAYKKKKVYLFSPSSLHESNDLIVSTN